MSSEIDIDCTTSCRLIGHGNALTKCLTKREISEEKLISFLLFTCGNFSRNLDENVSEQDETDVNRFAFHVCV